MELIQLTRDDTNELSAFLARIYDKSVDYWEDHFCYFWDYNPAFAESENRGYVVKQEGRIIAFIGRFPSLFQLDYHEGVAFNGFGLAVDPVYRRLKLGSKLREAHLKAGDDSITFATTPMPITRVINARFGAMILPRGLNSNCEIVSFLPINRFKYMLLMGMFWARYNARNPTVYLKQMMRSMAKSADQPDDADHCFRAHEKVEAEFDEFWDRTKAFFANTNVRTARVINWYLTATKFAPRKLLYSCSGASGELVGYGIFTPKCLSIGGHGFFRIIQLSDFWQDWNKEFPFSSFFRYIAGKVELKDYDAIVIPHFSQYFSDTLGDNYPGIPGRPRLDSFFCPDQLRPGFAPDNSFFSSLQGDQVYSSSPLKFF